MRAGIWRRLEQKQTLCVGVMMEYKRETKKYNVEQGETSCKSQTKCYRMDLKAPIKQAECNNNNRALTRAQLSRIPSINHHFYGSPFHKYIKIRSKTHQTLFSHKF